MFITFGLQYTIDAFVKPISYVLFLSKFMAEGNVIITWFPVELIILFCAVVLSI